VDVGEIQELVQAIERTAARDVREPRGGGSAP
jgi:hypothetical protein